MTSIPPVPRSLGWAGVTPFLFSTILVWSDTPAFYQMGLHSILFYGAIILSFLGGVHWGLELKNIYPTVSLLSGYSLSILPSLAAFLSLYLPPLVALMILGSGFLGVMVMDRKLVQRRSAPDWYAKLRYQLSVAVLLCLFSAFIAVTVKS